MEASLLRKQWSWPHHFLWNKLSIYPSFWFILTLSSDGKVSIENSPRGHKSKIHLEDCLELTLDWTRTKGGHFILNLIFGMTATNFKMCVKFVPRIIVKFLNEHKGARIHIQSNTKIHKVVSRVKSQYLDLDDEWCTMDSWENPIQSAPYIEIQKMFRTTWPSEHYVTHVFVFFSKWPYCNLLLQLARIISWRCGSYSRLWQAWWSEPKTCLKCTFDSTFKCQETPRVMDWIKMRLQRLQGHGKQQFPCIKLQNGLYMHFNPCFQGWKMLLFMRNTMKGRSFWKQW